MRAVNVRGTRTVLDAAAREAPAGRAHELVRHLRPGARPEGHRARSPAARELEVPYKRTKLEGERLALDAAREGAEVIVVNPTVPVGPGDLRPTPTGKMVADVAQGAPARIWPAAP